MNLPRILVGGAHGGGGKSLVAVGLAAAWRREGWRVAPFKKGPDYIDAAWLSRAAGTPCRNLDAFLMSEEAVLRSFTSGAVGSDLAVVEGNRGIFDGADPRGTYSSAELAKLLRAPVILVVDATKVTRTLAAVVLGCQRLDPDLEISGVVLNRIAGTRHESVIRKAVEAECRVPVLGAVPRFRDPPLPERHLGLVPPQEHGHQARALEAVAEQIKEHVDVERIRELALQAPSLEPPVVEGAGTAGQEPTVPAEDVPPVRIGVFRDAAFQFYYPENLEALQREGARLVEISPLSDPELPRVDALYVGGGFPESFAEELAGNTSFRASLRRAVEADLPVYAECGGTVYLGEQLQLNGRVYPMSGAVPAVFGFRERPDGHGYTSLETVRPNPFYRVGTAVWGHEFHYTYLESVMAARVSFAFRVRRGHGIDGRRDGLCYRNVLASYTHVHAVGTTSWAPSLVRAAARARRSDSAFISGVVS